jgi:hypothetical protein
MRKVVCSLATVILWLVLVGPAFAAGSGERVGQNIGNLIGGWAKSLYIGIAALVALMFLFNRKFADLSLFLLAAVLVGGFVMVPNEIAGVVRDIWTTITS